MLLPRLRPQLIGLDMDGTLCDSANAIPAENIAALRACRSAGIRIAVLTGRRRLTLAPKLDEIYAALGESDRPAADWLVATNSGALVWEYPGWRQLSARTMPPALAHAVAETLAPYSLNAHADPAASGGLEMVHLHREPSAVMDRYMAHYGQDTRTVATVDELAEYALTLLALPAEHAVVLALAARLRAQFAPEQLQVLTIRWPLLDSWALEACPPQVNKADALAAMARQFGIVRERVAAAGDDVNDTSMLAWAGHSAAMPHAPQDVAAVAQQRLSGTGVIALAPWLLAMAELPDPAQEPPMISA